MPRHHVENTKEFWSENEAKRANKHANKRIIYWPPFWNKVYLVWQVFFAGCRLKFHYNWKTAGTKKKGKAIDFP